MSAIPNIKDANKLKNNDNDDELISKSLIKIVFQDEISNANVNNLDLEKIIENNIIEKISDYKDDDGDDDDLIHKFISELRNARDEFWNNVLLNYRSKPQYYINKINDYYEELEERRKQVYRKLKDFGYKFEFDPNI